MPRSKPIHVILAALLCLPMLLMATPAASAATPTPRTPGAAAAGVICAPVTAVGLIPDGVKKTCLREVEKAWPDDPGTATAAVMCGAALGPFRVLTPVCVKAVEPVMGKAVSAAKAAAEVAQTAVKVAKFVANPSDGFEAMANHMKESATSLTETVMKKMNTSTTVELNATWFRNYYAGSFALGILVMALMLFLLYRQVASGAVEEAELAKGLLNGPAVIVAMAFTPVIGQFLSDASTQLANGTASWAAPQIGSYLGEEAGPWALLNAVTLGAVPGGIFVPIFMFGMMFLGSGSVLAGFVTQELGAYLSTGALGVAWGMWVHPKWRPKVTRLVYFIISLLLQKALLWLILGGVFLVLNNEFELTSAGDGFALLVALMGTAIGLLLAGLAPWSMLKYAPLMPGGNEHKQSGGGHMAEAVVGGVAGGLGSVAMQRAYSMARNDSHSSTSSSSSTQSQSSPGGPGGGKPSSDSSGSGSPTSNGWRERGVTSPPSSTGSPAGAGSAGGAGAGSAGGTGAGAAGAAARGGAGAGGAAAGTGGAFLPVTAAQAATSAVTSAVSKGRRVADDAAPQMGGDDV